jgi:hypothetical protein
VNTNLYMSLPREAIRPMQVGLSLCVALSARIPFLRTPMKRVQLLFLLITTPVTYFGYSAA